MMRARYVHTSGCCAYAGDALGTESWVKVYVTDDTANSLQETCKGLIGRRNIMEGSRKELRHVFSERTSV